MYSKNGWDGALVKYPRRKAKASSVQYQSLYLSRAIYFCAIVQFTNFLKEDALSDFGSILTFQSAFSRTPR